MFFDSRNILLTVFYVASLCNACGLRFQVMIKKEEKIPPNMNPQPIPLSLILNPETNP